MQKRKFKYMSIFATMILALSCMQYPTCGTNRLQSDSVKAAEEKQEILMTLLGTVTNNHSANVYWDYGRVVNSYFSESEDGTYERVEYVEDGNIIVEKYSNDYTLLETKEIKCEAPIFGGYYSGEKYNFLVYGRTNPNENNSQEVIRIIKYGKDWERLGKCTITGRNTTIPFRAGSLRMTEVEGKLYMHTCHEMYQSADGLNHQANMTFSVDEETMTLTETQCQVTNISQTGYVSHSFNQFIQADGKVIYRVDHGDAYPRGISITKGKKGSFLNPQYTTVLPIQGNLGDNNTGVSVGGFELAKDSCLIAGNSVAFENVDEYDLNGKRNIFVTITDKELSATKIVWLTDYIDEDIMTPYTPQLVKISEDRFLVMWEELNEETKVVHTRMALIDEKGTVLEDVKRADVALSDCQPIVAKDGLVKWYVSDGKNIVLYTINPDEMPDSKEDEPPNATQEPMQNPTQRPTQSPTDSPTEELVPDSTEDPGGDSIQDSEQNLIKGDVDGDKEVTLADAQIALKAALKIISLTESEQGVAEVNEDGQITLADAQMILKIALKIVELDEETAQTEAPIVQVVGTVDDSAYQKAVSAFEPVVKKMRADGLVKNSDVCVTMDSVSINADITFDNDELDLTLVKDNSTNSYTLTFDYDFTWLDGFGPTVNGKDPAAYNKELLIAMLSMVSDEPEVVFDRIDLDCFSAAGLYVDEWTEIADCFIMNGGMEVDKYISYILTKEDVDRRDASYVLTGTRSDGSKIECVIEYDSSVVTFETLDVLSGDGVTYVHTLDDTKIGPHCSFAVKNDCASYEEYKQDLLEQFIAKGDSDASVTEYTAHRVNGYTYYWIEGFYKTETDIGDPDFVYVQIGENEYIELYNVMFEERFEDFINSSFYVREVK